jgi:UDP-N-acetylmuramate--alanine ligase
VKRLKHIKSVYFVGVGGIGMSALARFCVHKRMQVYGYDKTTSNLTQQLSNEGIVISFEDDVSSLPPQFQSYSDENLVVFTPAIPKDNLIFNNLLALGYDPIKRSAFLGLISQTHYTLAVAGTHGKTTTSTLLAHIVYEAGFEMLGILGGISTNYKSNYIIQAEGLKVNGKPVLVTEADEFDRSFLQLSPHVAVITSTDADHLDIYGKPEDLQKSFQDFADLVSDTLILAEGVQINHGAPIYYGAKAKNAYSNLRNKEGNQYFDLLLENQSVENIKAGLPGKHNVENALAAIITAKQLKIPTEDILRSVSNFKGVKRRFEKAFESQNKVIIDDYAHHPEELNAIISAVRALYPNRKMHMVFQPHLYSRTRDFMDEFALALGQVDHLMINPIYPARELPIEGVTSTALLSKIDLDQKSVLSREEAIDELAATRPELLVIAGAGDIDRIVQPIVKSYQNEESTA